MFCLDKSIEELDALNTVMIDHLTNDMHIYEAVCLNVRDIQELKLIRLPATFHESKAKLRAIDPCLLDIRLSPSDDHEQTSNKPIGGSSQPTKIIHRPRGQSIGSNGSGPLISCSSNESSPSMSFIPIERAYNDSFNEQFENFSKLSMGKAQETSKPVTLLAKKVLPKKIERTQFHQNLKQTNETKLTSTDDNNPNTFKKQIGGDNHRKTSPIRVTITSKLNPNATPFYVQQNPVRPNQNSSFTFYERNKFQSAMQSNISQSTPNGIHVMNGSVLQTPQQQNHNHSYQRFVPPRQMTLKKPFHAQSSQSNTSLQTAIAYTDQRSYPPQQTKHRKTNYDKPSGFYLNFYLKYFT